MMASDNSKWLQRALAPALKAAGFRKSGATWWKESDTTIRVLNLQGSQWGPSFYINLGVYFRALGDRERPSESICHIRIRLSELVPDRARFNALLDLERPIPDDVRMRELEALVVERALPWLDMLSTVAGARQYCSAQRPEAPWVTKEARDLLASLQGA